MRQAIAYAIDKQAIAEKADYGIGKAATGPDLVVDHLGLRAQRQQVSVQSAARGEAARRRRLSRSRPTARA